MEKTEKQTGYRARPVAYNVKTSYAERETIKKTIVEIKKANDFKSETDALLYLVDYYEKKYYKERKKEPNYNNGFERLFFIYYLF